MDRKVASAMTRRTACRMLIVILVTLVTVQARRGPPDASSTLLKMHRLYMMQPPHDASLYTVLRVSPNATVAEITKSFRKLTRELHPDKAKHSRMSEKEREQRLQQVRQAYEVLKNDATRLPYHRFGLLDTSLAAFLLTGGKVMGNVIPSPEQQRLLQWMGYESKARTTHQQRVFFLAANLIERIRPLVEGAIDESTLADAIAQECDALKKVPLGAQVIRCIGRAYRHAGQRLLRRYHRRAKSVFHPLYVGAELSDTMRDKMRDAKQVLTAAVASGRLVISEKMTQRGTKNKDSLPSIEYGMQDDALSRIDQLIGEDDVDDLDSHLCSTEDIREQERLKAQTALLESLQVEALWKISKIDLDRTVQEACNLILTGEYFFFPSHQSSKSSEWNRGGDGWVGSTGEVVDANIGKLRAAAALVMIGDIMVQCSKEGTAWME